MQRSPPGCINCGSSTVGVGISVTEAISAPLRRYFGSTHFRRSESSRNRRPWPPPISPGETYRESFPSASPDDGLNNPGGGSPPSGEATSLPEATRRPITEVTHTPRRTAGVTVDALRGANPLPVGVSLQYAPLWMGFASCPWGQSSGWTAELLDFSPGLLMERTVVHAVGAGRGPASNPPRLPASEGKPISDQCFAAYPWQMDGDPAGTLTPDDPLYVEVLPGRIALILP